MIVNDFESVIYSSETTEIVFRNDKKAAIPSYKLGLRIYRSSAKDSISIIAVIISVTAIDLSLCALILMLLPFFSQCPSAYAISHYFTIIYGRCLWYHHWYLSYLLSSSFPFIHLFIQSFIHPFILSLILHHPHYHHHHHHHHIIIIIIILLLSSFYRWYCSL